MFCFYFGRALSVDEFDVLFWHLFPFHPGSYLGISETLRQKIDLLILSQYSIDAWLSIAKESGTKKKNNVARNKVKENGCECHVCAVAMHVAC